MFNLELLSNASLFSLLNVVKTVLTKSYIISYISKTSLINVLFIKHLLKTLIYILLILFIPNMYSLIKNELHTKMFNLFDNNNWKIIGILLLVGLIEIGFTVPFYSGIKNYNLSSYIALITILYIIFNTIISIIIYKENVKKEVIGGIIVSLIGISIILKYNGNN